MIIPETDTTTEAEQDRDSERHSKRCELRRKIAEAQVAASRVAEAQNELDRIERERDLATTEHGVEARKIQARLKELDAGEVERTLAGQPRDEQADGERRELLGKLHDVNQKLEATIERLNKEQGAANLEVHRHGPRLFGTAQVFANELAALASPHLQARYWVASRTARLLGERLNVAVEKIRELEIAERRELLADSVLRARKANWSAEHEFVTSALRAAREAEAEARQACLDE